MKKVYFWVLGYSREGKRALIGPYLNEAEANTAADGLDDSEVYKLETRSQQKATKVIKAKLFQESQDMDSALQPQLHDRGLKRESTKFASPTSALAGSDFKIFEGDPFKD